MITSAHNETLKTVRKAQARKLAGVFVAEGEDLVAEADARGWSPEVLLRAGEDVEPELLAKVSALGSGSRVLALYRERWAERAAGPLCVALWGVSDPGNVGTVLRGALAFGASSVAIGPGTADPFGPKAVRASMGAVFAVPVARVASVDELPSPVCALVARAGNVLHPVEGTILVGAERDGLPEEVVAACDETLHIPIRSESLNAAMAATVALHVSSRVRR